MSLTTVSIRGELGLVNVTFVVYYLTNSTQLGDECTCGDGDGDGECEFCLVYSTCGNIVSFTFIFFVIVTSQEIIELVLWQWMTH